MLGTKVDLIHCLAVPLTKLLPHLTAPLLCQKDTADCLTIRSSRICIQQQAFVKQILLTACWWVQDGMTVKQILLSAWYPLARRQQYLFDICLLLYVQS